MKKSELEAGKYYIIHSKAVIWTRLPDSDHESSYSLRQIFKAHFEDDPMFATIDFDEPLKVAWVLIQAPEKIDYDCFYTEFQLFFNHFNYIKLVIDNKELEKYVRSTFLLDQEDSDKITINSFEAI